MKTSSYHAPFDRYSVAYPHIGITYLAEVEWATLRPARLHDHRELQVLWILDGMMGLEMDGARYESEGGGCYVIPARREHLVFQRASNPRILFLDLRLVAEPPCTMVQFFTAVKQTYLRTDAQRLRRGAQALRDALSLSSMARDARLQSVLWEMIAELKCDTPAESTDADVNIAPPKLRAAEAMMRDRLAEPLEIEEIAGAAGLSRSQLTRLYRKHFQTGPAERLRQLRIEKACALISSSTLNVKEVAHVCGFTCPNHFCRVFLRRVGATPSEYRRTPS